MGTLCMGEVQHEGLCFGRCLRRERLMYHISESILYSGHRNAKWMVSKLCEAIGDPLQGLLFERLFPVSNALRRQRPVNSISSCVVPGCHLASANRATVDILLSVL